MKTNKHLLIFTKDFEHLFEYLNKLSNKENKSRNRIILELITKNKDNEKSNH